MAISTFVLQTMLKFVYYGNTDDIRDCVMDLLLSADEYRMEDLKKVFDATLVSAVTKSVAEEMEALAEKMDLKNLKDAAHRFAKK